MTFILALLFIGIAVVYNSFSWGFVCYKFWYWFLLPVFPTLPEIDFFAAVGIFIFISLFKNHNVKMNESKFWSILIISPWITLLSAHLINILFLA